MIGHSLHWRQNDAVPANGKACRAFGHVGETVLPADGPLLAAPVLSGGRAGVAPPGPAATPGRGPGLDSAGRAVGPARGVSRRGCGPSSPTGRGSGPAWRG